MVFIRKAQWLSTAALIALLAVLIPISNALAADIDKTQALARVHASNVQHKISAGTLNDALNNAFTVVIIEFHPDHAITPSSSTQRSAQARKLEFDAIKARFKSSYGLMEITRDYEWLPMQQVVFRTREDLVRLLEHAAVKGVYSSRTTTPLLAESLALINQPVAVGQGLMFKGKGTSIAILDSGIDYSEPIFGNCTAPGVPITCRVPFAKDFAEEDNLLDAGQGGGNPGHGTMVARIAAAVAPDANILSLDIATGSKRWDADVAEAISWLIGNKAQYNIVAANMSMGTGHYTSLCYQLNDGSPNIAATWFSLLREQKILPVVAVGNNGRHDGMTWPACTPGAVRVGATYDANVGAQTLRLNDTGQTCTDQSTDADKIMCRSNGGLVTLWAPGGVIFGQTGTSLAAPHVSGAIAILRGPGAADNESINDTILRLRSTAWPIHETRGPTPKIQWSLDLEEAVMSVILGKPAIH